MDGVILVVPTEHGAGKRRPTDDVILRKLIGVPLIKRAILAFRRAGIARITIAGHITPDLEERLGDGSRLGVDLRFSQSATKDADDLAWLENAESISEGDQFLLAKADHWYHPEIVQRLVSKAANDGKSCVCVDFRTDEIKITPSTVLMKVHEDGAIQRFGASPDDFNAIGCGLYALSFKEIEGLIKAAGEPKLSLAAAARQLADSRRLLSMPVSDLPWENAGADAGFRWAKRKLLRSLNSPLEGLVSRQLNRKFSIPLSRLAVSVGLTPNALSVISFLIGLGSGVSFALGYLIPGAIGAQVASIVDGSDGEVARLRFMESKWGGMLDKLLDRFADAAILAGISIYLFSVGAPQWQLISAISALALAPSSMMITDQFELATGTKWNRLKRDGLGRFMLAQRDGRLFAIFLAGLTDQLGVACLFIAVSSFVLQSWRLTKIWKEVRV